MVAEMNRRSDASWRRLISPACVSRRFFVWLIGRSSYGQNLLIFKVSVLMTVCVFVRKRPVCSHRLCAAFCALKAAASTSSDYAQP